MSDKPQRRSALSRYGEALGWVLGSAAAVGTAAATGPVAAPWIAGAALYAAAAARVAAREGMARTAERHAWMLGTGYAALGLAVGPLNWPLEPATMAALAPMVAGWETARKGH